MRLKRIQITCSCSKHEQVIAGYVIRKEAWSFYRTSSSVRLCWELEEPKGPKKVSDYMLGELKPKGPKGVPLLCSPFYGRACRWAMLGELKPKGPTPPTLDHPLDTHSEPSALYCWILEILYCNPKGRRALLRVPSTVGRSVCLCWEHLKPEGPKGGHVCTVELILEILCCEPKGHRALLRVPST